MQETADLLRRLHRFVVLTRRLDSQLPNRDAQNSSDRDIVSAALTLHELETILSQEPIFGEIDLVTAELPAIEKARAVVDAEAERLLNEGIHGPNQAKIAAGLQIYYNVKTMGPRVEKLMNALLDEITQDIKHVVDMQSLQKQVRGTTASTGPAVRRANHEPTLGNQSAWTQAIWSRMESLGTKMSQTCIKVKYPILFSVSYASGEWTILSLAVGLRAGKGAGSQKGSFDPSVISGGSTQGKAKGFEVHLPPVFILSRSCVDAGRHESREPILASPRCQF